ncbi:hypothetical protein GW17_00044761 [Ensete ventricosum]|nr:hypothetical protein GW17_00044761 [Ensete ventricosum]
MTNGDMTVTSVGPRTIGPPMWPTRRGKLVGRQYGGASGRTADLTQVRSTPQRSYGRPDTGKVDTLTCGRMPYRKDGGRGGRPTPVTRYEGSIHLAEHRLRPGTTTGELAHKGLNQQCSLSGDRDRPYPLGRH